MILSFFNLQYRIVEEFRADALLIVHNTVIYHGGHSNMADVARQMFRGKLFRKYYYRNILN